jgi:hypothetical protein
MITRITPILCFSSVGAKGDEHAEHLSIVGYAVGVASAVGPCSASKPRLDTTPVTDCPRSTTIIINFLTAAPSTRPAAGRWTAKRVTTLPAVSTTQTA